MQYHVSAYLHYICASREARESGSTTKEMRFREKRGKRREGGWAVVSFVLLSRYLPVGTQYPWEGDTLTRRTETLPTAARGPPATKESETP